MRRTKITALAGAVLGLAACSSPAPTEPSPTPAAGSTGSSTTASSDKALLYFEGTVDPAHGTMSVVTRAPAGLAPEVTLPYGYSAGNLYFHTCSATAPTTTYGGGVTAINLMSAPVTNLNAVIDSVSETGVTLASGPGAGNPSGIIAAYGTAPTSSVNCTSPTTWTFHIPGPTPFSFKGHATGYAGGLVAYWSLNEGSGTTFGDGSGNGQAATTAGGSWQPGESGTGYDGPAVSNAALPVTNTGFTVSVWAKRTGGGAPGTAPRVISFDTSSINGFEIADYPSGTIGVWNGTWNSTQAWPAGFVHIVVTSSTSQTLVYIGGSLASTLGGNGTDFTGFNMDLGQRGASPGGEPFVGIYDEVRVYNRVLSASEVAAIP